MLDKIIDFSINNKFIIGLGTLILIGLGIWSMTQVPFDAQPDITNNQVQVITQAPNLSTTDIEQFVTYPVEVAMSNLPGVQEIRSISRFGLSVVTIVFDDDLGTYLPRQLVGEKLSEVEDDIPEGFGAPSIGPISTGLGEIYQYTLEVDASFKNKYSLTDLRSIQDWIVKRQLAMVPGVVEINGVGGNIKQYEVAVRPDELKALGVSISEIFVALKNNNQNTGGAYIERNHQANFIRGQGLASSIEDIENIVIKNAKDFPILIKDVAVVKLGNAVRYGALTKNGQGEAVGGMIMMLKGANSNDVITDVKNRIASIQKSLPEGVRIKPFLDRSRLIEDTTSTITENLVLGGLIVIFVLVILLGNWRGGLIVASTIPLSLLFAFIMMHFFGVWANLMSLGAIDFGIIVDGAVIIVESTVFLIYERFKKNKVFPKESRNEIAATSAKKMMNSAFFGQFIILIVFLPILALEGVEGKMFKPMALTFIFAMLGAMILCLTYVPAVSARFLKPTNINRKTRGDRFIIWLQNKYQPVLSFSLKNSKLVLGTAIVLFGFAVLLFTRMGGEFVPELDEGDIAFHIILKPGSSLDEGIKTSTKIEAILLEKFPEIKQMVTKFGVSDVPTDPMPMDMGDSFVILKPKSQWESAETKEELIEKIRNSISHIPGVSYEFSQPVEMRFNELLTGVREDVAIKLYGEDLDVLASKASEIGNLISDVEGIEDLKVEATAGLPQITINYNRNKLAQYGLQISDLNNLIETAYAGGKAGVIFEGERKFDLVVRLEEQERKSIESLRNLYVPLENGSQIPIREVADISFQPGPMQISRDNTNRRTYVGINISNRDVKSVVEDIQQRLDANFDLPPGYYIRYGGAFENLERASSRLKIVVPIALLLIFILIYFALKSFKQTTMIYMAIPMAAIGGVFALWLRDMPFSISAGVGFIVLFGVAVLNGLVLISSLNELKAEGEKDLKQRISLGAKRRIRPILLTALTDVLGFLPMAVSASAGAEVQRPLATVVIGGMITSTLLTLIVLPILYQWMEQPKKQLPKTFKSLSLVCILIFMVIKPLTGQETNQGMRLNQQEAIDMALDNYQGLKAQKLAIDKAEALKKTAWSMGNTQIFTGGEEISQNRGVYTPIGIGQQNMELFNIGPNLKLEESRIKFSEIAYDLNQLEVEKAVKKAWNVGFIAQKRNTRLEKLDSVYLEFKRAIELRLETEVISELEALTAINKVNQIKTRYKQSQNDLNTALYELNLWLGSAQFYSVASDLENPKILAIPLANSKLDTHPYLSLSDVQTEIAEKEFKATKANLLPKFNLQYGFQKINGEAGFYSYQAGISIPVFSGKTYGENQAAKISRDIAGLEADLARQKLEVGFKKTLENYKKWRKSWEYYSKEALLVSEKQQRGALLAFKEGAMEYTGFLQILDQVIETELMALEALENYLQAAAELEYYLTK